MSDKTGDTPIRQVWALCRALPGTTEDVKWGDDLCFCINAKMYCVTGNDPGHRSVTLKVPEELFASLTLLEGIAPARYVGRYSWITIEDCSEHMDRLRELIPMSYDIVLAKQPAKFRKALQAEESKK